jgi:cytochrome P450
VTETGIRTLADTEPPDFPFPSPAEPNALPAQYAELRGACPYGRVRMPSGDEALLLMTYEDVATAQSDPRLTHDLTAPGSPRLTKGPSFMDDKEGLLNKEGAEHLRIRRIVASAFTPRAIERWKPVIRRVATELLDAVEAAGPPTDLFAAYCFPLPVRIICKLLGVPDEDNERFRAWSNAFILAAALEPGERRELMAEFAEYGRGLIARHRAEPGEDLIDALIAARDGQDRLSEAELVHLTIGLIAAGNETTSNTLGRSLVTLLRDDAKLWRELVDDPGLMPAAVDELLRHTPLGPGASLRMAVEDIELPSVTIKAGEAVLLARGYAMRDGAAYPEPDAVRFDREAPPQLVFGGGPHYCLGAHLAKAELQIGLGLLAERLPTLRLNAQLSELRFTDGEMISALIDLPVAW